MDDPQQPLNVTVTIDSITPVCPGAERPGLDGAIFIVLAEPDQFIGDMRVAIPVPNQALDEDSAVRRYPVYLSLLVDIELAAMAALSIHKIDIATLTTQRMLVEYAAKAEYFARHPDYALYMMTIGETKEVLRKVRTAGTSDADTVTMLEDDLAKKENKDAHVAHLSRKSFFDIMGELESKLRVCLAVWGAERADSRRSRWRSAADGSR